MKSRRRRRVGIQCSCWVDSAIVPLPSVCFASTMRNVPGSCTVHVKDTPRARSIPAGHATLPKVRFGYASCTLRSTVRRAARRGSSAALAGVTTVATPVTTTAATSASTRTRARRGTVREATGIWESYSRAGDDGDHAGERGRAHDAGDRRRPTRHAGAVRAKPPGITEHVLRRSAQLGLGAIGLAGRAAGTVFARVPDPSAAPDAEPGIAALLPGAVLGMALEAEKRASAVVDTVATHSTGVVRAVGKPAFVQRALRPLEDRLWQWNEVARREQLRNQAQASALIPVIVQQVTENVIAQLDFVRIVEQIPIDDIAGAIDVEAIVQRIDLGGGGSGSRRWPCSPRPSTRFARRGSRSTAGSRASSTR